MKLRLLDDTIRLRLSRSDVSAVAEHGLIEGQTRFPGGAAFRYALEAADPGAASADCTGGRLVVRLSAADIAAWAGDDNAVSLHGEFTLADGSLLTLLVEKDFQCLTPRAGEDQGDMYPNPDSAC